MTPCETGWKPTPQLFGHEPAAPAPFHGQGFKCVKFPYFREFARSETVSLLDRHSMPRPWRTRPRTNSPLPLDSGTQAVLRTGLRTEFLLRTESLRTAQPAIASLACLRHGGHGQRKPRHHEFKRHRTGEPDCHRRNVEKMQFPRPANHLPGPWRGLFCQSHGNALITGKTGCSRRRFSSVKIGFSL